MLRYFSNLALGVSNCGFADFGGGESFINAFCRLF